jgi:tetrahydromethanopterin S-methyltransferase subunit B
MTRQSVWHVLVHGLAWGSVGALLNSLLCGLIASPITTWQLNQIAAAFRSSTGPRTPYALIAWYFNRGIHGIPVIVSNLFVGFVIGSIASFFIFVIPNMLGGMILNVVIHSWGAKTSPLRIGIVIGALIWEILQILIIIILFTVESHKVVPGKVSQSRTGLGAKSPELEASLAYK